MLRPATGELVLVVTSPGRVASRSSGLFVALGEAANPRLKEGMARPTDVMPTALHALGVPISRDIGGRPLVEMLNADFGRKNPVRSVTTYGPPATTRAPREGGPLDQEMVDRLRSLGYVR